MANLSFNAAEVEPAAPREVLQPGDYVVQVVQSEMRETSTGSGSQLVLEMEVLDGPSAGRRLWDRLNIQNHNAQAQEIAQRQLSALCRAVGKMQINNSDELHFAPVLAKVKVRPPRTDPRTGKEYEASNEVAGYRAVGNGAAPAGKPAARPAVATAARPEVKTAPWKQARREAVAEQDIPF